MRGGSTTIIHGETCVVSDFDQVVTLPPIGAAELNASMTSTSNFNVAIECDAGAVSGTVTNTTTPPVAMGFLVTQPTALAQAAEVAGDGDVGVGGGADVIRQALAAGKVDVHQYHHRNRQCRGLVRL